jgi:hypothetical protein
MSCNTAASSITAAGHEKPTFKVQSGYEKLITSMNYSGKYGNTGCGFFKGGLQY